MQMQQAPGDIQLDHVAVLHQRKRPTRSGFRGGVQHHRAVGSATHARIADTHHVGNALFQNFRRQRHVAYLGHSRVALGAAVFKHHHAGLVNVQVVIVDSGMKIFNVFKHHRAAGVDHQFRRGGTGFDDRAAWCQIAAQYGNAGVVLERRAQWLDDLQVVVSRIGNVPSQSVAIGCYGVQMQMLRDLLENHR